MKQSLTLTLIAIFVCFSIAAFLILESNNSLRRKKSAQSTYGTDAYLDIHTRGTFGLINLGGLSSILSTTFEGRDAMYLHMTSSTDFRPSHFWFDWSIFPSVPPHGAFDKRFLIRTLTPDIPYDKWEDRTLHTKFALRSGEGGSVVVGDWANQKNTAEKAEYEWQVLDFNDILGNRLIKHVKSGLCLEAEGSSIFSPVKLYPCNPDNFYQNFK